MWISGIDKKNARNKVLKYLLRDNCKKIIAWTETTKKEIINKFPEVKNKIEVVYYAMKPQILEKKKIEKDIVLFFSGRHFEWKGGIHATEAIDRLTKKYSNVKGIINGVVPRHIVDKYSNNNKIKIYQLIPYKEILEIYKKSDIFIYPGYSDTFGFVFMEAMSFGIPIITVDGFARKEIVEDKKNGYVIPKPKNINVMIPNEEIINKIIEKASILIEDEKLREKMSKNCIEEIKYGKFSMKKRNEKLKKIYEEAMG
jgi:glycosyltransferase involved in cell wall biosynthesis